MARREKGWPIRVTLQMLLVVLMQPVLLAGCDGVDIAEDELVQLQLLDLYPHDGEVEVPVDVTAVAVFSHPITFGSEPHQLNETTLKMEDDNGNPIASTLVEKAPLDDSGATVLLVLPSPSPLHHGDRYWLVLAGSIRADGTEPLGSEIRTYFVTK